MPAIAKVTKEMIIDAAFEIAREMGAENITARTVSQKLGCSTQPVLYHFKTIEDVRIAAHKKAGEFHIDYVTNLSGKYERPMLEVGMRYIQFAVEEKNLFRFLYHSNYYTGVSLSDWLTGKIFDSLFPILRRQANVDEQQAYSIFSQIVLVTHGIASLLANNAMVYDEAYCIRTLSNAYFGIMYLIKEKLDIASDLNGR
ncbi:TetR/AcrR family transcriptional regulator [bacterium 1xD8-48]|nr:TetR/AcrR family transcriptional regulator [bacterium 1xD8-48]